MEVPASRLRSPTSASGRPNPVDPWPNERTGRGPTQGRGQHQILGGWEQKVSDVFRIVGSFLGPEQDGEEQKGLQAIN